MSTAVLPRLTTVEEFLARPRRTDGQTEELIEGIVYVSPNVKFRHMSISRRVQRALTPLEDQGYEVHGECAIRANDYSLSNTDACVITPEQVAHWEAHEDEFPTDSPVLAIEVLSPGNRQKQIADKVCLYLERGAEEVWVINPKRRIVTVHLGEGDNYEVREGESLEFRGLTIDSATLYRKKK